MIEKIRAWTRKIYLKSQEWGKSPNCIRDLTVLAVISCTIIPIPVEALLVAIIAAAPRRWLRAALAITIGSVLGALVCYLVGNLLLGKAIYLLQYIAPANNWEEVKNSVSKEGIVYIAIASFTPGLFRVGMVAAGVLSYNIVFFAIGVAIGRAIRFFLEAALLRIFGNRLNIVLEKYFELISLVTGTLGLVVLVIMRLTQ